MIDETWYTRSDDAPLAVSAGGAIVRVEQDQVLIALAQQRATTGFVLPKGHVDPGEDFEQAARREVTEEAGFTDLTLLGDLGMRERYNGAKTHWKRTHYFLFLTQQVDAAPLESDRHAPPAWFPLDDLPTIAWPEQRQLVEAKRDEIARLARQADAMVVGGFTPYSTLDSRTKAFLERLYPLRHQHGYMAGKPGGAVITSCVPADSTELPPASQMGINAIQFYMMEEGMNFLGAVEVKGNVPCLKCGRGDGCNMSGITMLYGPEATVDRIGFSGFEDQPQAVAAAKELGAQIAAALEK